MRRETVSAVPLFAAPDRDEIGDEEDDEALPYIVRSC